MIDVRSKKVHTKLVVGKDLFLARKENGGETHQVAITYIQKEDCCVCVRAWAYTRERERESKSHTNGKVKKLKIWYNLVEVTLSFFTDVN